MDEPGKPFFRIELQGRQFDFGSLDEISNWVQQERQQFTWMMNANYGQPFNNASEHYRNSFDNILGRIQAWRADPTNPQHPQQIASLLRGFYSDPRVVLSDSPIGQITIQLAKKMSAPAAVGAYACCWVRLRFSPPPETHRSSASRLWGAMKIIWTVRKAVATRAASPSR